MSRSPAKRRRPEARPEEILDAALAVFTENGFAAARVEDVAARAGLSKGAIYLYFPSKEAMLNALVERSAGALASASERLVATGGAADPEAAYRAVLTMILTTMADPAVSAAPRLVLAEAQRFPGLAAHYRSHVIDTGRRTMLALLEAGVAKGVFRAVEAEAAMRAFAGPVIAHMLLTTVFQAENDPEHDPAEMAEAIADIVLYGLKPREGQDT